MAVLRSKVSHVPEVPPSLLHIRLIRPHLPIWPPFIIHAVFSLHDIAVHIIPVIRPLIGQIRTAHIEARRGWRKMMRDDEWRDWLKVA